LFVVTLIVFLKITRVFYGQTRLKVTLSCPNCFSNQSKSFFKIKGMFYRCGWCNEYTVDFIVAGSYCRVNHVEIYFKAYLILANY
jgi:Zn finger protein HypA/HybF involved in hydrogenase expression